MTHEGAAGTHRHMVFVEAHPTKATAKRAEVLYQSLAQRHAFGGQFAFEPSAPAFAVMIGRELEGSWTPLQEANISASEMTYADLVKSGELVRERLQTQLGAVFGYPGFDAIRTELTTLRQLLETLTAKVDQLAANPSQSVCLRSFAPEPFEAAVPVDVLIVSDEDGFQASFLDANLHAYGETREEALFNMKATILETYQRLREMPDARLGRSMLRQKRLLSHYLREAQTG